MLIHCTPKRKVIIINLIAGFIKKDIVWNIALQNKFQSIQNQVVRLKIQ